MIRLRQIAIAARQLDPVVDQLCAQLGLTVCFRDPGVAEFGLVNALMTIGDQFLEVVAPATSPTTAGRLLDKRCGADNDRAVTGYMAIYEVDDLDQREEHVRSRGVRVVWSGDFSAIRGRHLHPADVGGAIVSIDQPNPAGSWRWAGVDWTAHADTAVVSAIAGVAIGANDPGSMRTRWAALGLDHSVSFQPAGAAGEGVDVIELVATDRARTGEVITLDQLTIRLV